jgi:hypothetical protein
MGQGRNELFPGVNKLHGKKTLAIIAEIGNSVAIAYLGLNISGSFICAESLKVT